MRIRRLSPPVAARSDSRAAAWLAAACAASLLAGCAAEPTVDLAALGRSARPVVGGTVDDKTTHVVGLGVQINAFYFGHCTGTLIAPNLVLTARHCVALTASPGPAGSVVCGKTPFTLQGPGEIFRATTKTVRATAPDPSSYGGKGTVWVDKSANDICGYDLALIVLDKNVPASEATPAEPRVDEPAKTNEIVSAVGFGLTEAGGKTSGTRMRIDNKKVVCTQKQCTGTLVKDTEFGTDLPTCQGDSGGPAFDSQGRVIGVLSRGPSGCNSSVYGDVALQKDLIVKAALFAAKEGGYEPADWVKRNAPDPDAGASGDGAGAGDGAASGDATTSAGDGAASGGDDGGSSGGGGCAVARSGANAGGRGGTGNGAALGFALALLLGVWLSARRRASWSR